ncbi:putative membrane protein [Neorhizobium galegae]|nr:putative membrane protein [Neorhizobium galegae]
MLAGLPSVVRHDVWQGLAVTTAALVLAVLAFASGMGIWGLAAGWFAVGTVWGSLYNRLFTTRLISKGYKLGGTEDQNRRAMAALGLYEPGQHSASVEAPAHVRR